MFDLIFFTSSKVKLSHANYIFRNEKVRVVGFREKTYHASYDEPRISDREKLLNESYLSALEQAKKAGMKSTTPFVLEDTSVNIFSLTRKNGFETPGLDVKFWMKEIDFHQLDTDLKEQNNGRLVEVRSDVILHVPSNLQVKYGHPYLHFVSKVYGSIVENEVDFDTQELYPWLDNKSFNKWFAPHDESKCISRLDIEKANKYDFRRRAFLQVRDFLADEGYLDDFFDRQNDLDLIEGLAGSSQPDDLIVAGLQCAGKTSIAQFLNREYGYVHIEASDFMHALYRSFHDIDSSTRISVFAQKLLQAEPTRIAEQVKDFIENNNFPSVVITGFRKKEEVDYILDSLEYRSFKVVYVDATSNIRKCRFENRARLQLEGFDARDARENEMGLAAIKLNSSVIVNESSIESFFGSFMDAYVGVDEKVEDFYFEQSDLVVKVLLALKSVWVDEVDTPFLTTTEITKHINREILDHETKKHKDNVSRFFNQKVSPLFELTIINGKKKYRLSNTGYSVSLFVD